VTTRLPDLKILVHHLGAMIPFFDAPGSNGRRSAAAPSDEDYGGVLKMLGKPLMYCFKDFLRRHGALRAAVSETVCGLEFFRRRSRALCFGRAISARRAAQLISARP